MLSAFQLENNRLTRWKPMRSNTSPARCGSIWSSLTTMSEAACRRNWVKTWRRARNWKISKPPRVSLKMKTGYTSTRSSFEDADDHAGNSTVAFTIREAACSRCASMNYPLSASTVCACVTRRWSTATPTNCCSTCSRPKSSSWRMKLKTSTATGKAEPRHYGRPSGRRVRRSAVDAGGTGRYRLEGATLSDGYPARAELPRAQGAPAGGPAGAGAGEILRDIESLLPLTNRCSRR